MEDKREEGINKEKRKEQRLNIRRKGNDSQEEAQETG